MCFTALVLLSGAMALMGCRQPVVTAARLGWVEIDALQALHPSQGLVSDLDHRLQALAAQRARLLEPTPAETPPARGLISLPAYASLPAPTPPARPDYHTQELIAQESSALQRVLERDQARRFAGLQRDLIRKYSAERDRLWTELTAHAAESRRGIQIDYSQPLVSAKLSRGAASRWAERQPAAAAARLAQANARYEEISGQYAQALDNVDAELIRAKRNAQAKTTAALHTEVIRLDAQLHQEYAQLFAQENARVVQEYGRETMKPVVVPTMPFMALPAVAIALETPEIAAQFQHSAAEATDRALAVHGIDQSIVRLQAERTALLRAIEQETRAVVTSLATQHGYRLSATRQTGVRLTAKMRAWLEEYWGA
ncbi:MAG TPA: hypothetical protein VGL77_17005 [Armatimonadota bacterium]|jgi:hypothetical protein